MYFLHWKTFIYQRSNNSCLTWCFLSPLGGAVAGRPSGGCRMKQLLGERGEDVCWDSGYELCGKSAAAPPSPASDLQCSYGVWDRKSNKTSEVKGEAFSQLYNIFGHLGHTTVNKQDMAWKQQNQDGFSVGAFFSIACKNFYFNRFFFYGCSNLVYRFLIGLLLCGYQSPSGIKYVSSIKNCQALKAGIKYLTGFQPCLGCSVLQLTTRAVSELWSGQPKNELKAEDSFRWHFSSSLSTRSNLTQLLYHKNVDYRLFMTALNIMHRGVGCIVEEKKRTSPWLLWDFITPT